jgi:hypothetical protein
MSLHAFFSIYEEHFVAGTAQRQQLPEWKISLKEEYRLESRMVRTFEFRKMCHEIEENYIMRNLFNLCLSIAK